MSFQKTPCTFSIAAVLGKEMITVFVSSCLYTEVHLQSVASSSPHPTGRRGKTVQKKVFKGQGGVYRFFGKGRRLKYKVYYQPLLPGLSNLDIRLQVFISRIGKLFNGNWSFNALQAVFFHSPVTQSIQSYPSDTEYIQSFISLCFKVG